MKARLTLVVAIGGLALASPTLAQSSTAARLARADVHAAIGWAHVHATDASEWGRWDNGVGNASAWFGWYWTDHLKTEIGADTTGTASFYRFEYLGSPAFSTSRSSTVEIKGTAVGVLQQYQFLRNAWVHPFLGAGVEMRRERRVEAFDPVTAYDAATREWRIVEPARRVEPPARWQARGVLAAGLKGYASTRVFARVDLKVALRGGVDEAVLRFGLGVDF